MFSEYDFISFPSVIIAIKDYNYTYVGIDKNEEYFKKAKEKIKKWN